MRSIISLLLLGGGVVGQKIVLKSVPYHVRQAATSACTVERDIHLLSGTFDMVSGGGTIHGHVLNGSIPDYSMAVGGRLQLSGSVSCHGGAPSLATRGFIACNRTSLTCDQVVLMDEATDVGLTLPPGKISYNSIIIL
jgi:hypothetical protein